MKGTTGHFNSTYNKAGSSEVKVVDGINSVDVTNHKQVPSTGKSNSVTKVYNNGKLIQERYYGENGEVYLDIDYTDHNRPDKHPVVPHQHKWNKDENGNLIRKPWEEIKK